MKEYCENQYCEAPAIKEVPVSVHHASDQKRSLCSTCHEAYIWGVQHGRMASQSEKTLPHLTRLLTKDGFIVLTHNDHDPSVHGPFEAWVYQGSVDIQALTPVTFGIGPTIPEALEALEFQLRDHGRVRKPKNPSGS